MCARLVLLVFAALAGLAIACSWYARRGGLARRQALDLALQACRVRADLLSRMGDELRTPLNVIRGMGELLARTPLSAGQKDYVAAIQRSSAQLLRMIEDILDVSRPEESAPPPRQTAFSAATLVGETAPSSSASGERAEAEPELAVLHAPVAEAELRAAIARIRREPPPSPTVNEAPLDRPRLVRNLGDDEQAADQVLSAFVAQAGDSLTSLHAACASGDLPGIARTAHRLKGSLMWIGADRAARGAESLESRANAGDADGARTILAAVEGEVRAVVAAIRDTPSS